MEINNTVTFIIMPHYIVNEELETLAKNAIKSFRDTSTDIKIINVDDGSPRDTEFLKELGDYYIRNDKNSGFAKTCNKGLQMAIDLSGNEDSYIVCANNDIEVQPGWQKAMIDPFNQWDNVAFTGLISCRDRNPNGIPIKDFKINLITEGGLLRDWMQSGGLWMSKISVLKKIGLFDEQFERGGFEDVDIFLRARDTFGMSIIMSGWSCFWHKEGATRWGIDLGGFNLESKDYDLRNGKKFANKWGKNYINKQIWYSKELRNG